LKDKLIIRDNWGIPSHEVTFEVRDKEGNRLEVLEGEITWDAYNPDDFTRKIEFKAVVGDKLEPVEPDNGDN
jgi:hypothetical protein